jgi:hypothetical protein
MIQQLRIYEIFENDEGAFQARFRDPRAGPQLAQQGKHGVK